MCIYSRKRPKSSVQALKFHRPVQLYTLSLLYACPVYNFCFNAPCQFPLLLHLRFCIFSLTPNRSFSWTYLSLFFLREYNFLYTLTFPGKQIGRKTRAWCILLPSNVMLKPSCCNITVAVISMYQFIIFSLERSVPLKKERACNGFHPLVAAASDDDDDDDDVEYCHIQGVCKYRLNVLLLCPQLYNAML